MSLKERREVVSLDRGAGVVQGVLFSVVRIAGSSYRQPGARMLVLPDGRTAGTLSGGCLEADVLRRAAWTVRSGAVVEHFSTGFDDTSDMPYGLGCGGEIDLLAEPSHTPEAAALLDAMEATLQQAGRTVATLLPVLAEGERPEALRRIVIDDHGDVLFASESLPTEEVVLMRSIAGVVADETRCTWIESPLGALLVERLMPVQRLVIFGAGEDARPLCRLAGEMGWQPVVVDTRAERVTTARFPGAECLVANSVRDVPVQSTDAVVLMTHSYQQDRLLLAELLAAPPAYLGLLGARHRSALLLHEASAIAGVSLADAVCRTHAPVGLRLGGEGPEAVALSVVAQVHQVLAGLGVDPFESRRLTPEDVDQLLADGPSATVYTSCALTAAEPEQAVAR